MICLFPFKLYQLMQSATTLKDNILTMNPF